RSAVSIAELRPGEMCQPATAEPVIATGFPRLGPWDDEPADPNADRFDQLDDIVATTSQVFLGLTLACARCHDHKFEALTMHDYYRMVAVFDPLKRPQDGRTELDGWAAAGQARERLARRVAHGGVEAKEQPVSVGRGRWDRHRLLTDRGAEARDARPGSRVLPHRGLPDPAGHAHPPSRVGRTARGQGPPGRARGVGREAA